MQDYLRFNIKCAKVFNDIPYKYFSDYLNMNYKAFLNWLKGYYEFGNTKRLMLEIKLKEMGFDCERNI